MKFKTILLLLALCVAAGVSAQTNEDVVDRVSRAVGVRLPDGYEAKVKEFAANNEIMKTRSATAFTEQFIIEQFKNDWGINRQNQLLFMWSEIYGGISQKILYSLLDDDNDDRYDEYSICQKKISEFYNSYKKGFKEYMDAGIAEAERRSAEAKQQSAEAERRSAEAIKGIMRKDTLGLMEMREFYSLYIKNPNKVKKEEIEKSKDLLKWVIPDCKKYNIDYKAILRKELGNDKKVEEVLKFYGVE